MVHKEPHDGRKSFRETVEKLRLLKVLGKAQRVRETWLYKREEEEGVKLGFLNNSDR